MGKRLNAARTELRFAREAIEAMKAARTIAELDVHWKEFLSRTTRIWNKTEASLKGDPKFFNSVHTKRAKEAQKRDPLIKYLARARDADEHTIDPITEEIPAGPEYRVDGPNGSWISLRDVKLTRADGKPETIPIRVEGFTSVRFAPAEIFALPAVTRGQTTPVPDSHNGHPIAEHTMVAFAELGLAFYTSIIDGLENDGWDR
ncbi:hypothetical protein [Caballeronia zhejiangensis]|uniref:hypothetical protein n=1 Tax=Caballeronia zhejiangensis TaxID=871203 RepID=UPI001FD25122|nr:hypothetical protein [Caballeronia zhejiangensis]